MKKKKILIVVNRFYPEVGGAELNTYKQALELAKEFDVTVVCPERTKLSLGFKDGAMKIVRMFNFRNLLRTFPYQKPNTLCFGVLFRILFGSYYAVLCFPAPSHNSFLALIASKMRRIPCLLVSFDLHDYSRLLKEGAVIREDLSGLGSFSKVREFFVRRFSHIFAISNREISFYKRFNDSVSYSPVAIDFDDYNLKVSSSTVPEVFNIVMIGRVSHIKGQDIGLEGFHRLLKMGVKAKLKIVGRTDFEPNFSENLRGRVKELGLEQDVEILGSISREKLLKYLRESQIHLIPVRFMNSGAVVVESLASGTFVIQSDMVDPSVVVEHEDGLTFKSGDINDLGVKLHQACELISNQSTNMEEARERVLKEYNYEVLGNILKQKILKVSA